MGSNEQNINLNKPTYQLLDNSRTPDLNGVESSIQQLLARPKTHDKVKI